MTVYRLWLVLIFMAGCATGCQTLASQNSAMVDIASLAPLIEKISPDESVAVSWIYEAESGDITALGNIWRDRIAMGLKNHDLRVKERKDVVFLIDDLESFGAGQNEGDVWKKAEADVIVTGTYRIIHPLEDVEQMLLLHVKAIRIKDAELIQSCEWQEQLRPDWFALASGVRGNVYQKKLQTVTEPGDGLQQPRLKAWLNAGSGRYQAGENGQIHIETDIGVYLYLFNLAADNTVTLLYPNRFCRQMPVRTSEFVFPGHCSDKIALAFYPLMPDKSCRESVMVVASRQPFDFSYVPFQTGDIYHWVKGEDVKKIYQTLRQADSWKKVTLDYEVRPGCKK